MQNPKFTPTLAQGTIPKGKDVKIHICTNTCKINSVKFVDLKEGDFLTEKQVDCYCRNEKKELFLISADKTKKTFKTSITKV